MRTRHTLEITRYDLVTLLLERYGLAFPKKDGAVQINDVRVRVKQGTDIVIDVEGATTIDVEWGEEI